MSGFKPRPTTRPGRPTPPPPGAGRPAPLTLPERAARPPASPSPTLAPGLPTPVKRPITWADRNLSGKLVFTAGTQGILQFDMATGELTTLFAPPDPINSWVVAAARSPVAENLVMAYTPPPPAAGVQFGYADPYTVSLPA